MMIGIDGSRYAHKEATGVEWYSFHIINELLKLEEGLEFEVYSREALDVRYNRVIRGKKFWTLWHLSAALFESKPDVLFVPSHTLPLYWPKRAVITIHDVAFRRFPELYDWKERLYLNWSTWRAVKKADGIIVPSQCTKLDLIEMFDCDADKIEVIPHGFEWDRKRHAEKESFLLYVGRIEAKKNLERLVEAFGIFLKVYPSFRLVLAGKDGFGAEGVRKKVRELRLEKKVEFKGYVTENEKKDLLERARGFVFPSLYEGFGLPILEAFAAGAPVACARTSSLPEVAGNAACYFDPENVDKMFHALTDIVKDGNDHYLMEMGTKRLAEFSWQKAAKATLAFIKKFDG